MEFHKLLYFCQKRKMGRAYRQPSQNSFSLKSKSPATEIQEHITPTSPDQLHLKLCVQSCISIYLFYLSCLSIYLSGFTTAVTVFRKLNAIPLCFSTDLVLNFLLSWLLVLLQSTFFLDVLFSFSPEASFQN